MQGWRVTGKKNSSNTERRLKLSRGKEGIQHCHYSCLPLISGCSYLIASISQLWSAPPHLPRFSFIFFPLQQHLCTALLGGQRQYILSFQPLFTAIIQMCGSFLKPLHLFCVIYPSLISFTLSLSPALSSYAPFYSQPYCLVIEGEILWLCDSPLLSDIKQGGFVDYQGKLIMTW